MLYGLVNLFILVLLRMLLRRTWLAVALWCVLLAAPLQGNLAVDWALGFARAAMMAAVLALGGLLGLATALFVWFSTIEAPITLHASAWYAGRALPVVAVLVGLAVYGFHVSLGGKPALGGALDD